MKDAGRGRPCKRRDIELIKKLYDKGCTYRWLAREFRVSLGTAFNIVNGKQLEDNRRIVI